MFRFAASLLSSLLAIVSCRSTEPAPSAADALPWEASLEAGLARARAEGRPALVFFTASWAAPARLTAEALSDPRVRTRLKEHVLVRVDVSGGRSSEARRFGVELVPTLLTVTSDGAETSRLANALGPEQILAWLE